ncbi:MAG: hypothetical protein FWE46_05510, partial [Coriobacteriia bacterium]|nr:hypothetical protein [Coriobacteriia bacterium]
GALFAALCMWLTFALLLLSLLGVAKPFYRRVASWRDLVLPGALAMILALVLIVGLSLLNGFQLATLGA